MSWIHQVVQIYEYTVLLWLGTWLGKLLPGPMDSQLGNLQEQPQRVVLQANLSIWCSSDLQNPHNKGRQLHAQGRKFGWWLVFQMCSFSLNDLIWLVLISSFCTVCLCHPALPKSDLLPGNLHNLLGNQKTPLQFQRWKGTTESHASQNIYLSRPIVLVDEQGFQ